MCPTAVPEALPPHQHSNPMLPRQGRAEQRRAERALLSDENSSMVAKGGEMAKLREIGSSQSQ